jgi:FkbM family methyltransferase
LNLRNLLTNKSVKYKFDINKSLYAAIDGNQIFYFVEKSRYVRYQKGIQSIGDSLAAQYFINKIKLNKGDFVVDCGANVGELGIFVRNKASYIAFEPGSREFRALQQNFPFDQSYNFGLWNKNKKIAFYDDFRGADSSFILPNKNAKKIFQEAKRLDSVINFKIKILKIEGEGAEPEIIYGCSKILNNIHYISADLGPERGLAQENTTAPVINFLLKNNFELVNKSIKRDIYLFRNLKFKKN